MPPKPALASLHRPMPGDGNPLVLFALLHPPETSIGADLGLLATERRSGRGDVVELGGCAPYGVYQSRFGIHADVRHL